MESLNGEIAPLAFSRPENLHSAAGQYLQDNTVC